MKKWNKQIITVLALSLIMSLVSAVPSDAASEKESKRPKLPESVKVEYYDKASKKWEPYQSYAFVYNKKGDPTEIIWEKYTAPEKSTKTISYKYRKNGKRKSATYKETGAKYVSMSGSYPGYTLKGTYYYDRNGRRTKIKGTYISESGLKDDCSICAYKYHGAGVYTMYDLEEDDIEINSVKHSKPVKTRRPGILKNIRTKSGEVLYAFNKEGLFTNGGHFGRYYKYRYTHDKKTGLVKSVRQTSKNNKYRYRYTFVYTSKSISESRYSTILNSILHIERDDHYLDDETLFIWY